MSDDITFKTLKLKESIPTISFNDILKDINVQENDVSKVRLSEEQLKTFLSLLFVYAFHYDTVDSKNRPIFLKAVFDEKIPFLEVTKWFCVHLLNELDITSKLEFDKIYELEHNLLKPLSNERILDFVEIDLLDIVENQRKWEYGRFVGVYFSKNLLKDNAWNRIIQSFSGDLAKKNKYLQTLEKQIEKKGKDLKPAEVLFLQLIVRSKLLPENTNIADYLLLGTLFQKKSFGISLAFEKLTSVMENAIKISNSNLKGKGENYL